MFSFKLIRDVAGQAFQEVGDADRGRCTFDFDNPSGYFAYNGVGRGLPRVGNGENDHAFLVFCKFQVNGQAGLVTQSATWKNAAIVPTIVVPFTDMRVTNLVQRSNVECTAVAGSTYDSFWQVQETYALNSATSIPPFVTSTTVVVPTSVLTTSSMSLTSYLPITGWLTCDSIDIDSYTADRNNGNPRHRNPNRGDRHQDHAW